MRRCEGKWALFKLGGNLGLFDIGVLELLESTCPTAYPCLFKLRPGVLSKTLTHMCGKLNLPMFLFNVGLLTLIKIDSLIFLAIMRVNNPTLNMTIGKFNLPNIWNRVLLNTPGLNL